MPTGTTHRGPMNVRKGIRHSESVRYFDDFFGSGKLVIPSSAESGMDWLKNITGAAPPTVAGVADGANGLVACSLTATSEAQEAALHHGDQRGINLLKAGYAEGRVIVPTLPTLNGLLYFGLAGDRSATPDSITYSMWFKLGTGNIFAEMDDNATDRSTDTGMSVTAADVIAWRIDWSDISNVLYYLAKNPTAGSGISWQRVASATTFAYAATGANAVLQPYFVAAKASGAGLGVLQVDYIDIGSQR